MRAAITSLVAIRWTSNVGYAIAPLERLFYETALDLAGGDPRRVHFVYRDLASGPPRALPAGFANVHAHELAGRTPAALQQSRVLLESIRPEFVLSFDMQPEHPVYPIMRRTGARTIMSYWGAPMSGLSPWWKLRAKQFLLRVSRSRLDGLVFESEAMADFAIRGRGVPRHMIDIVPLGIDIERFAPAASDHVHRTFDIPPERRVVVFAGHCTPRKGIQTLIDTAIEILHKRRRKDVYFLICGNTADESPPYEAQYRALGIGDGISFAGYRSDMIQILQSAFCGFIPSTGWDSFPRTSVEMAGTGLPVVASRLQGLAEAVLHRRTGLLFEPGRASEAADAIEALLDDPALAARLGRAGRQRCEQELNLRVQRERFTAAVSRHIRATSGNGALPLRAERA